MKTPTLRFLIFLVLLSLSATSQGLALSEIELKSYLNQLLDARIRLTSATQADLDSLTVSVTDTPAEGQTYVSLQYEITQDDQGSYIHITSRDVVREPVLKLRIDLNWAGGRLARDYSLIIDPR